MVELPPRRSHSVSTVLGTRSTSPPRTLINYVKFWRHLLVTPAVPLGPPRHGPPRRAVRTGAVPESTVSRPRPFGNGRARTVTRCPSAGAYRRASSRRTPPRTETPPALLRQPSRRSRVASPAETGP